MSNKIPTDKINNITFPAPPSLVEDADGVNKQDIRLNLNEASFGPSPMALEAAQNALVDVNRYPTHDCAILEKEIFLQAGIGAERLSFGNGSGEILVAIAMMCLNEGDDAIMPNPTFPTCAKGVQIAGGNLINIGLRADGVMDIDAMLAAITTKTKLFYICSPNNPTGGVLPDIELQKAIDNVPKDCLLVVDEAYYEFAKKELGSNVIEMLELRNGPWVVTRSFSKAYCMAGLRVGYAICSDEKIKAALWQLRPNFNVNRIAIAAAAAAMKDEDYLEDVLNITITERTRLQKALEAMGCIALPSFANFLTVKTPKPANYVAKKLFEKHILVQPVLWPDAHGMVRITIGSPQEIDIIIAALKDIFDE